MLVLLLCVAVASGETLFKAEPVPVDGFTAGVEGPAFDRSGNLFAVAFRKPENIARITPDGTADVFVTLPHGSCGNGIVFDSAGRMYVADYKNHNILRIDPASKAISVFAHDDRMHQPNDLAIAPDGTIFASDPDWDHSRGQVWKTSPEGKLELFAGDLGTANGIEVSPDGKTLYVNESVQRKILKFDLTAPRPQPSLFKSFSDFGLDGMRCDVKGNLYVARFGNGAVLKLTRDGTVLQEIDVLGAKPSNICLGGPDGRTAIVTEMEKQRLITFRVDEPGQSWARWNHR
jgi:sugar lactone lactonase YvrE